MKHTTTPLFLLALGLLAAPAWAQTTTPLLPAGSAWKYLDNGSDQGTAWQGAGFNDAAWAAGNTELGYGDGNEATVVSFGPSSSNKFVTTYFRKTFTVGSLTGFTGVKLRLKRDDGAVVYLNGTEVHRSNMPSGPVAYNTFASATVDAANESTFFETVLPKSVLTAGTNTIAVEVHQDRVSSSDISFDLELLPDNSIPAATCAPLPAGFISSFTSVQPRAQQQDFVLPATHTFQVLLQGATPYTTPGSGNTKLANDFTGYVPINGSSQNGYLSINHEGSSAATSGVSILDLSFNATTKLWNVTAKNPVNFAPVVGTYNNCSGGITPWNTVVTCEENTPTGTNAADSNNDGYLDYGWNVELDPATRSVKDQNNDGTPDKLWKMGRFRHENVAVAADRRTVYEGADEGSLSYVYKYVAATAGNLSNGTLYVLKLDGAIGTATTGTWVPVPNSTPTECNTTVALATALGATDFNGVEDIEISPLDGKIYFTAKGTGRVYRFADGPTVSGFEIFAGNPVGVTNQTYPINYGSGTLNEAWGTGADNLTFDSQGNLYVLQDGGRNHIWLIKPCHTQAAPQVEVFALIPANSEPTGMTFSPDENFMFLSLQGPDAGNTLTMADAAGQQVRFNTTTTLVIGRKGTLGLNTTTASTKGQHALAKAELYPNPASTEVQLELTADRSEAATVEIFDLLGKRLQTKTQALSKGPNRLVLPIGQLPQGQYTVVVKTATTTTSRHFIKQ
ncbi:hypothetical protein GCM10027048_11060 [Hymenobacter coalescens]